MVDNYGVPIHWKVNGTLSTSSTITSLGIVTNGEGTQSSSLIIPGNATIINPITIRCIASGYIDGLGPYFNSSSAILYIQGVINL